ncbi:hypothetical protein, partial [uncultured Faecalibaculum sp.]|uniref:hypothetical protein n=1 Tax=uncultured Faecalibaculum sp. TaxID=1729681 RepID=UPI0025E701B4
MILAPLSLTIADTPGHDNRTNPEQPVRTVNVTSLKGPVPMVLRPDRASGGMGWREILICR